MSGFGLQSKVKFNSFHMRQLSPPDLGTRSYKNDLGNQHQR